MAREDVVEAENLVVEKHSFEGFSIGFFCRNSHVDEWGCLVLRSVFCFFELILNDSLVPAVAECDLVLRRKGGRRYVINLLSVRRGTGGKTGLSTAKCNAVTDQAGNPGT
jgi:hypothetical protein